MSSLTRFAPLAGIPFVASMVGVIALEGDEVGEKASAKKIVSAWSDRSDNAEVSTLLVFAAVFFLLVFITSLYAVLRARDDAGNSASTLFLTGGIVSAMGFLTSGLINASAMDLADQGRTDALLALHALADQSWILIVGGMTALYLGAGTASWRTGALPKWLAIFAIILGVAPFTLVGGFASFMLTPIWVIAAGIVLFMRQQPETT